VLLRWGRVIAAAKAIRKKIAPSGNRRALFNSRSELGRQNAPRRARSFDYGLEQELLKRTKNARRRYNGPKAQEGGIHPRD
jgi:hypothetical protein